MPPIKNTPIGLMLPIRAGSVGYFDQSIDSFTAYRMNIINLLRTRPGERRMNPTFGCRLWNVTFEPNDDFMTAKVQKIIVDDVNEWIPGVTVSSVDVQHINDDQSVDSRDIYKLYIVVSFIINSISVADTVKLTLDVNKV